MDRTEDFKVTRGKGLIERFLAGKRADKVKSLMVPPLKSGKVLDIGCGSYPWFLKTVEINNKYGLDKSLTDEVINRFNLPGIDLKRWNHIEERDIPFENGFFDYITMLAVFEHIELDYIDHLVSEILRTLKPGGKFILTTPAAWTDPILRGLARINVVSPEEIDDHKDTYTIDKIKQILIKNGFQKEKIIGGTFECFMNLWVKAEKP